MDALGVLGLISIWSQAEGEEPVTEKAIIMVNDQVHFRGVESILKSLGQW